MNPLPQYRCLRCGHEWTPRLDIVTRCPRCKSPLWNTPMKLTNKDRDKLLSIPEKPHKPYYAVLWGRLVDYVSRRLRR